MTNLELTLYKQQALINIKKIDQARRRIWDSLIFSHKQRHRPPGYCAPTYSKIIYMPHTLVQLKVGVSYQ